MNNYRQMIDEIHPDPELLAKTRMRMHQPQKRANQLPFYVVIASLILAFLSPLLASPTAKDAQLAETMEEVQTVSNYQRITQITQHYDSKKQMDTVAPIQLHEFEAMSIAALFQAQTNTIYSPLSSNIAIGMLYSGLDGTAKKELAALLQVSQKQMESYANKAAQLTNTDGISMDNSIWFDSSKKLHLDKLQEIATNYDATAYSIDFSDQRAIDELNSYIEEQSSHLLSSNYHTEHDLAFRLINLITCKANWQHPFSVRKEVEPFFLADGTQIIQNQTLTLDLQDPQYEKKEQYERMDIPLDNGCYFRVILPASFLPLSQFIQDSENLIDALYSPIPTCIEETIDFKMPAFTVMNDWNLTEYLKEHHVTEMFNQSTDDLHLLGEQLYVGSIQQLSAIHVNENGIQVAAQSVVDGKTTGVTQITQQMNVNRPFLYALLSPDHEVVYTGTIYNPNQE